jgi:hypothetical protein
MLTTFLDLIAVSLWPLALSAAAWAIAITALGERDEISKVVETLTQPHGVEESAMLGDVSRRHSDRAAVARILRAPEL